MNFGVGPKILGPDCVGTWVPAKFFWNLAFLRKIRPSSKLNSKNILCLAIFWSEANYGVGAKLGSLKGFYFV